MGIERDIKRFICSFSRFVIPRFPFWEALSTALLLGEWDGKNRSHGVPDIVIYGHIGFAIIVASLMSFDEHKRKQSAILAAVQMFVVALVSLVLWNGSSDMVRMKIFFRYIGMTAMFLQLSSGFADSRSSRRDFAHIGHILIGVCLIAEAYLLYAWSPEKRKLFYILPSALSNLRDPLIFILCILLAISAICFIVGKNLQVGSKLALALWLLIIMVNIDYKYWDGYMELWAHFRILVSDVCFGLVLAVNYAIRD